VFFVNRIERHPGSCRDNAPTNFLSTPSGSKDFRTFSFFNVGNIPQIEARTMRTSRKLAISFDERLRERLRGQCRRMRMWTIARACVCCVICLGVVQFGRAQPQDGRKPSDPWGGDDISNLTQEVKALREEQRRLIDLLDEIKKLLAANVPGRPELQPPAPPTVLSTLDETFRGEKEATVSIIEYADFECPYCGQYEREIYPQIAKNYIQTGKVKYFYRDLPLPMHPHALVAARAARCAGEQGKLWEMHDSLFANQNALRDVDMPGRAQKLGLDPSRFSECLSSDRYTDEINRSAAEAEKMGIGGTPTFFIGTIALDGKVTNVKMILGVRHYDAFKSAIEDSLGTKRN
jgi:protein-disulfide isomerase